MNRLLELIKKNGLKAVLTHWYHYRHLLKSQNSKQVKFIVFGQGRSGSTLLTKLLDQHPDIFCDQEIFGSKQSPIFLFPEKYIESNARKPSTSGKPIYGFKVKVYQLFSDQKIKNIKKLLDRLHKKGWKFIFLYREDEMAHNVSSFKAFSMGTWFVEKEEIVKKETSEKLYVDPVQFEKSVLWRRKFSAMEKACLQNIPHIPVSYEKDLLQLENHQEVCNRIFEYIGVKSYPVQASVKKMNETNLKSSIKNYAEIEAILNKL
ncbi:hypothetical protein [Mangrovimonas sp. YM274]|uniref:hypothetical protein n=1 Tax=Mangrovimonas sp. YM274 TaxID=3070660 RepID=UPI0027DD2A47|nr:hypothetical protein [Mangrovimonas sp. YM274]WMI68454.1 hypothetical protein RBH95_15045 [Mangrovimonas sp. YM274]